MLSLHTAVLFGRKTDVAEAIRLADSHRLDREQERRRQLLKEQRLGARCQQQTEKTLFWRTLYPAYYWHAVQIYRAKHYMCRSCGKGKALPPALTEGAAQPRALRCLVLLNQACAWAGSSMGRARLANYSIYNSASGLHICTAMPCTLACAEKHQAGNSSCVVVGRVGSCCGRPTAATAGRCPVNVVELALAHCSAGAYGPTSRSNHCQAGIMVLTA